MARRAAASDLSRSQLLQQARNKAYYEKKKHLKQIQSRLKAARSAANKRSPIDNSTRESASEAQYPVTAPATLPAVEKAHLTILNSRLHAWGYLDEPRDYIDTLKSAVKKARRRTGGEDAWIKETEDWIEEGDSILLALEQLMGNEGVLGLHPLQRKRLWRSISATAFSVQFMIAMTTVKLDEVEGRF